MATVREPSAGFTLVLTEEERTQLLNWLEERLRNKRVEEHRTEAFDYRDLVLHEESVLESLIGRLRRR
jgi:hypothetical protein